MAYPKANITGADLMNKRGFTLIEVMVALAIIAIALASLIKASGNHTYSAAYLKSKTLAHYVAMNEIAELKISKAWPDLGTVKKSSEMAGTEWYWIREIQKTADESGNIRSVQFTVFQDEDREQNLTSLQAYLSNPASSASATATGSGSSGTSP